MRPALVMLALAGCGNRGDAPPVETSSPTLRRLTQVQYGNAIHDVLGDAIVVPTSLEPDSPSAGLYSVGASLTTISPRGVEQYEAAAFSIAEQVMADPTLRGGLLPCEPSAVRDDACAEEALRATVRRLWRRSPTDEELARLVAISGEGADVLGDFDAGFAYALSAALQSPNFLFRAELGEAANGGFRFTDVEMASRLSFFLWNTTPDDALLDAAENGDLSDPEAFAAEVDRLLADPRAIEGSRNLFSEWLGLYALDALNKDPLVFVHMSEGVGASAREQTLLDVERIVWTEDEDFRELLLSRRTHLDRKLAAIYDVPAPSLDGFAEAELPEDGGRVGFLGSVGFLAPNAHPASSSATLRGIYVREVLLCQEMAPPPADLNTGIPEVTATAPTLRDRVALHLTDPFCASCHNSMDLVGLGFENFDGLGSWRDEENGAPIDPSGEVDGEAFVNAAELATLIAEHRVFSACVVETALRYANGHVLEPGEEEVLDWHTAGFEDAKWSYQFLLRDLATSPAFRTAAEVQ